MTMIYQVDAFASKAFAGNPAAVVPLEREADERWMQRLALEMNLSETAFLWPQGDVRRLRWFTPRREVKLCGHATLASAHVLWETGLLRPDEEARFETRSGRLTCRRVENGAIAMDFPARPGKPVQEPPDLVEALGARPREIRSAGEDLLVVFEYAEQVRRLEPNFPALARIEVRGVAVTAPSSRQTECDFVSRFFAPRYGIDEDPVTGSAHCALAVYWAERLGKERMIGYQASARGGRVAVELRGDRVELRGGAVTVFTAELSDAARPPAP